MCVLGSLALRFALDFSGKTRHLALWVLQMRDHLYTLLLQQEIPWFGCMLLAEFGVRNLEMRMEVGASSSGKAHN